jgi:N-acetylmuramoyl-L-alanine amidase
VVPIDWSKITTQVFLFFLFVLLFSCASSPIIGTVKNNNLVLIIIDSGHGGSDNGAVVDFQKGDEIITFREKDLTLKIARLLAAKLNTKLPKAQIVLTRTDDVFLSLEERVVKVNQISTGTFNTVFVSIHINYSPNEDATGFEVYYYIPALLDPDAFITVQYLKETLRQNTPFAESILNAIGSVPELENLPHSMKSGNYYVLRNTSVPAVLIECGFLSNEKEALLLNSVPYQEKLAEVIALGIENYLKGNKD